MGTREWYGEIIEISCLEPLDLEKCYHHSDKWGKEMRKGIAKEKYQFYLGNIACKYKRSKNVDAMLMI